MGGGGDGGKVTEEIGVCKMRRDLFFETGLRCSSMCCSISRGSSTAGGVLLGDAICRLAPHIRMEEKPDSLSS